jgi:hypothetical protein
MRPRKRRSLKRSTMSLQVNWKRSLGSNLQAGGGGGGRVGGVGGREAVVRLGKGTWTIDT